MEAQAQIDDRLYVKIYAYIARHGMTLQEFAKIHNIDYYMFQKAMDRDIKMNIFETLIKRIREIIGDVSN